MNKQLLIINHLSYFVAVCLEMSYKALGSCMFNEFWHPKLIGNNYVRYQTHLDSFHQVTQMVSLNCSYPLF